MQFYRIKLLKTDADGKRASTAMEMNDTADGGRGSVCCMESEDESGVILLAGVTWTDTAERAAARWMRRNGVSARITELEELSVSRFAEICGVSGEDGRTPLAETAAELGLELFGEPMADRTFSQMALEKPYSRRQMTSYCDKHLLPDLKEELQRIFSRRQTRAYGHPVHYILEDDGVADVRETADILLTALRMNGRLRSKQVMWVDAYGCGFSQEVLERIYRLQQGSAVVIRLRELTDMEKNFDADWRFAFQVLTTLADKYRASVLTVFITPTKLRGVMEHLRDRCGDLAFIWLGGGTVGREQAEVYLKKLAAEGNQRRGSDMDKLLSDLHTPCTRAELQKTFERWRDNHLRTVLYPAYRGIVPAEPKPETGGNDKEKDALQELDELIGLDAIKAQIRQVVDYHRVQKVMVQRGICAAKPGMHMVFTGAPGTAKTTAARLVGRICKQYGVLSVGGFIEVGRSELVGQYVGWTAKLVHEAFARAKGSVLFIDEAYALVDGAEGYYGDEAIHSIVQEMENLREDVMVIFAGYPQRMEQFLSRNEGLRSRISFHVDFPDYSESELHDILLKMVRECGRELTDAADAKARKILGEAMADPNFGNGRYVRNMVDKALMAQASRLVKQPLEHLDERQLRLLVPEDFQAPAKDKTLRIGFQAE